LDFSYISPRGIRYANFASAGLVINPSFLLGKSRGIKGGFHYHKPKPLNEFKNWLTELNSPAIVQMVMAAEPMVRAIATIPIIFDFWSSCLRYFQAYQSPNGAIKKLIR
jgi:hypothetical protein